MPGLPDSPRAPRDQVAAGRKTLRISDITEIRQKKRARLRAELPRTVRVQVTGAIRQHPER